MFSIFTYVSCLLISLSFLGSLSPLCPSVSSFLSDPLVYCSFSPSQILSSYNRQLCPGWYGGCDSFRQAGSKLCKQPLVIHDSVQHPRASINPRYLCVFLSDAHLSLSSYFLLLLVHLRPRCFSLWTREQASISFVTEANKSSRAGGVQHSSVVVGKSRTLEEKNRHFFNYTAADWTWGLAAGVRSSRL